MTIISHKVEGFTLIELMIVMSIVALLTGMVGPLAISSVEKTQAKQEMLSLKYWLKKIADRAYYTGKEYNVSFEGKQVTLTTKDSTQLIEKISLETIFFQPQVVSYSAKGFIDKEQVIGVYRKGRLELDLKSLINGVDDIELINNRLDMKQ